MFGNEAKQTAFKILTVVSLFQGVQIFGRTHRDESNRNSEGRALLNFFFLSLTSRHTLTF